MQAAAAIPVQNVTVAALTFPERNRPSTGCWAADGKSFYTLDPRGVVRRISAAALKEEATADLALPTSALALSAEGLLVLSPTSGRVVVLDPASLKTRGRIEGVFGDLIVSTPALSLAISGSKGVSAPLTLIDVKGSKATPLTGNDLGQPQLSVFDSLALTPDGKYLFAGTGATFHRFRLADGKLKHEESSHGIRNTAGSFEGLYCDDGLVSYPCGGGNNSAPDHPQGQRLIFVYSVENIRKPAVTLRDTGAHPMAFDHAHERIVCSNGAEGHFAIFNRQGTLVNSYVLGRDYGTTYRLFIQPQGEKLLLLAETKAALIDLPKPAPKP
jgi:hypothetical protein